MKISTLKWLLFISYSLYLNFCSNFFFQITFLKVFNTKKQCIQNLLKYCNEIKGVLICIFNVKMQSQLKTKSFVDNMRLLEYFNLNLFIYLDNIFNYLLRIILFN